MRITYACPACEATTQADGVEEQAVLECRQCGGRIAVPAGAVARDGDRPRPTRCLVCPSTELFIRKDFPQLLGVAIVTVGLGASCVAWAYRELTLTFAILFGSALLDVVLYFLMPDCLSCYRCGARYRGPGLAEAFAGFDLETHEKHRQLAARMRRAAAGNDPS
jgi:DNA-directed RNA polymerase subunit RPC12/RpoP